MTRQRSEGETIGETAPRGRNRARRVGALALGVVGVAASFAAGIAAQSRLTGASSGFPLQFAQASPERAAFAEGDGRPATHTVASTGSGSDEGSADDGAVSAATFASVYSLVNEHYVDALPTDREMSFGALRSLLSALNDPQATFLDADAKAIFQNESEGTYAGIGASLYVQTFDNDGYTDHKIVVVSTLPGSPAERAGLRPHDVITHVDGKWVLGSDPFLKVNRIVQKLEDAHKDTDTDEVQKESDQARRQESGGIGLFKAQMLLRGDDAIRREYRLPTNVSVTINRVGSAAPLTLTLTPAATTVAPVAARPIASNRAGQGGASRLLVKIPAFTAKTADEVAAALVANADAAGRGVALDLRGNAGGVSDGSGALHAAAQVACIFTPAVGRQKPTFAVELKADGKQTDLADEAPSAASKATPDAVRAAPLVILVDGGTAGAAEALAAALSDGGRATLMGGRTFGDAVVQTVYPLPDPSAAFTLVTGRLLSPKRVSWAGTGLQPKVALAPGATEAQVLARTLARLNPPRPATQTAQIAGATAPRVVTAVPPKYPARKDER